MTAQLVYLAGPMTGLPAYNFPAFHNWAYLLRKAGHDVVNPAELFGDDTSRNWDFYMRGSLRRMLDCTHVFLLNGWVGSKGATLEWQVATALGMQVVQEHSVQVYGYQLKDIFK